ncbi:hypothetical protein BGZ73_007439 [Actinomortierella ambigua]|nr:hypothetical protein BGZ73_007439 [Actinomortierella ambigua]
MTAIAAATARVLRSPAATRAATSTTRRWYSLNAPNNTIKSAAGHQAEAPAVIQGHSTKKLVIYSGVSTCVGFDTCYIYYNFGPGSKRPTSSTA